MATRQDLEEKAEEVFGKDFESEPLYRELVRAIDAGRSVSMALADLNEVKRERIIHIPADTGGW